MKIIVAGTNWIGDAVMTIPAVRAIRQIFPQADITISGPPSTVEVFAKSNFIDGSIVLERSGSSIKDVFHHSNQLRSGHFDLSVLFTNSFGSALVHKLAGIPSRIGYSNEGRGILLTDSIPKPEWKNEKHEVFYYLNLIAAVENKFFGTKRVLDQKPDVSILVTNEQRNIGERVLIENGVDLTRPTVALGIGSTNSRAKRWPAERFADLAKLIIDRMSANVILVGSNADREVAEQVIAASTENVVDLTGKTTISGAIGLLSKVDLLISNDMGLAHVAPAVKTPTIVIFGPTNPVTTRPFSDTAEYISAKVECSPCMLRDCPIDHRCMVNISAQDVYSRAQNLLFNNE